MKKLLTFLVVTCTAASLWAAKSLPEHYASQGKLIITEFTTAPFPHPDRAQGYHWKTKNKDFPAAQHYSDSHVAIFIPKGFRVTDKIDFVVHFHGWGNNVNKAIVKYELIDQFVESKRNAILLIPQGPYDASDSFGGKLEDPDGFKNFIEEAMNNLRKESLFNNAKIGKIILSGHSGGYQVISSILASGGLTDHVKEVYLFDALYARTDKFAAWQSAHHGRLINIYTERGGTKKQTETYIAELKSAKTPIVAGEETKMTIGDLEKSCPIFILSKTEHDEVMQKNQTFCHFLETSALGVVKIPGAVPAPRASR